MREQLTKERRAELRKAMGSEAVKVIDTLVVQFTDVVTAMNNQIVPNLNALMATVFEQQKTIAELRRRVLDLESAAAPVRERSASKPLILVPHG